MPSPAATRIYAAFMKHGRLTDEQLSLCVFPDDRVPPILEHAAEEVWASTARKPYAIKTLAEAGEIAKAKVIKDWPDAIYGDGVVQVMDGVGMLAANLNPALAWLSAAYALQEKQVVRPDEGEQAKCKHDGGRARVVNGPEFCELCGEFLAPSSIEPQSPSVTAEAVVLPARPDRSACTSWEQYVDRCEEYGLALEAALTSEMLLRKKAEVALLIAREDVLTEAAIACRMVYNRRMLDSGFKCADRGAEECEEAILSLSQAQKDGQ